MLLLEFGENTRSGLLEQNLVEEAELNDLIAALKQHLQDPETLVLSSIFVQAWGTNRSNSQSGPTCARSTTAASHGILCGSAYQLGEEERVHGGTGCIAHGGRQRAPRSGRGNGIQVAQT